MKNKQLAFLIIVVIAVGFGVFIAVRQPSTIQKKTAENVLTNLLNAPNERLAAAYDAMFESTAEQLSKGTQGNDSSGITSLDSPEIWNTISELSENKATESFLESCVRINEIMSLQQYAMIDGIQSELQELSVVKTQQKNILAYDAVLLMSMDGKESQTVHVSGQVQFDEAGKISAITLRGRELSAFLQSLAFMSTSRTA